MDVRALLLASMMFSMLLTFLVSFVKLRSFRIAFLITMVIGTKWTLVISIFGYDKPLATFYLVNKANPAIVKPITITACQVVSLVYVSFIVLTLAWPWIVESLPREVRKDIKRVWEVRA